MHVPNNNDSGPAIKQLLLLSGSVIKPKPSDGSRLSRKREYGDIRGRPLLARSGRWNWRDSALMERRTEDGCAEVVCVGVLRPAPGWGHGRRCRIREGSARFRTPYPPPFLDLPRVS